MIDRDKILDKLRFIEGNLAKLRPFGQVPVESFADDYTKVYSARYLLQTSIEAMIDVANHIIARNGWGSPKSYAESFTILTREGILSKEMLPTYIKMARFRNRVVHLYDTVDDAEVYGIVRDHLGDFEEFMTQVGAHLGSLGA